MDTTILIFGIVIVALFVVPMAIISNHGKAQKEKRKKQVEEFAMNNELTIKDVEYFKDKTLALDRNARKLIYFPKEGREKLIDLSQVNSVKINKQYENEEKKIIGSIDIALSTKDENIIIPFYHHSQKNSIDLYEMNESSKVWMSNIESCKAGR